MPDQSPLLRIAVAIEGVLAECRKIADCIQPPLQQTSTTPNPLPCSEGKQGGREFGNQESLTEAIALATREQPRPPSRSPYLGANDAAEYLGITISSLYGVVERGDLTPLRGPRRTYRFTQEMLDDYLKRK